MLEEILVEYPWFQTANILYLKNLYKTGHLKFNKQLRKSAGYIADRKVLYNFLYTNIPDYKFDEEVLTDNEKKDEKIQKVTKSSKKEVKPKVLKKDDLKRESDKDKEALKKNKQPNSNIQLKENDKSVKLVNESSKYSFDDWLKLFSDTNIPNISKNILKEDSENKKKSKFVDKFKDVPQNDLINKFIELNPRLENKQPENKVVKDISLSSVKDDDGLITETLAKIYIAQKHFVRAIQAYQKLSLKYPEKNIYFANQIKRIKKLNNE